MALTEAQQRLLDVSKEVALEIGGRRKVLTGLIGELSACLGDPIKWEPSDGYDAINGDLRVQVKTSSCLTLGETMGWFGRNKKKGYTFEIAMHIELDNNSMLPVYGIWESRRLRN